jgi:hypothetical protein
VSCCVGVKPFLGRGHWGVDVAEQSSEFGELKLQGHDKRDDI